MNVAALLAAGLISLQSAGDHRFDVDPGSAPQAVNRLAAQAGVDVIIAADIRGRGTSGLHGNMSTPAAFERLLRPLGARAVRIGDSMYRIEAAPTAPPRRRSEIMPADAISTTELGEIVVTDAPPVGLSNARGRSLIDAGALSRVEGGAASDAIADLTATVDSTRQGTGRNKLFVRGLADSAMNGPLQATVGQYFGDLRLSYGSPDPDLALVDIRRVEVFEGPQGTRFGIGAIGGILRLQPEPPALDEISGRLILGAGVTSGGAGNGDGSVVLNHPLGGHAAGRLVAYARRDGGFLDNPALQLREQDGVDTTGGRAALRWNDGAWAVDLTGLVQRASAEDSQTVSAGETRFNRSSRVTEPYESAIALAGVAARRRFAWGRLASATSVSRQTLDERFDASQTSDAHPSLVDRRQTALSASSELRFDTDPIDGWIWSGGVAVAFGETTAKRRRRDLSSDPLPDYGVDLTRTFAEAAVFGEASLSPAPDWRVAAGARLSVVHLDTDVRAVATAARLAGDLDGATVRISPSLSARWDVSQTLTAFGRLEQAVRPAGVSEANGAFARYQGDRVTLAEIGLRTQGWSAGLSSEASVGWVDWRDVQADIVTQGGDLVTDNVGDGVISFVSVKASWAVRPTFQVSGSLFINDSRLTATRFSVIGGGSTAIPNVAPAGAQLSLDYEAGDLAGAPLRLGADFRYVGQSRLGVGPALDVPQGGYLRTELTARLGDERRALTLRISNPLDQAGTRYGIGSPYQLSEPQSVPVRPLTVRLGFETAF